MSLLSANTPDQSGSDLGAMAMNGYPAFPNAPALLKPHYQIAKCQIRKLVLTLCIDAVGVFYYPRKVGHSGHSLGGLLPLCRDEVGVFYSPSRVGSQFPVVFFFVLSFFRNFQWRVHIAWLLSTCLESSKRTFELLCVLF